MSSKTTKTVKKAAKVVDVRHEAALKSWETRRAAARKRSEAAKKAWITRRLAE